MFATAFSAILFYFQSFFPPTDFVLRYNFFTHTLVFDRKSIEDKQNFHIEKVPPPPKKKIEENEKLQNDKNFLGNHNSERKKMEREAKKKKKKLEENRMHK